MLVKDNVITNEALMQNKKENKNNDKELEELVLETELVLNEFYSLESILEEW